MSDSEGGARRKGFPNVWRVGQAIIKIRMAVCPDHVFDVTGALVRRQTDRAYFASGQIYERVIIERKYCEPDIEESWHFVRNWIKAPPPPDACKRAGWSVISYNPHARTGEAMQAKRRRSLGLDPEGD